MHDEALAHQLAQDPAQALLGDVEDAEQVGHRHARVAPDEIDDPVVGPAKSKGGKGLVGFGGEIAVGKEQHLDALPQLVLAQKQRICW